MAIDENVLKLPGGQPTAEKLLQYFFSRKQFPTTFLFHGPDSTVMNDWARLYAAHLLCYHKSNCGQCSSCQKLAANVHPDLITFPGDKTVAIGKESDPEEGTIRYLINKKLPYRPLEGHYRLVIFEDSSAIGREAEIALLKSLEDGPSHTLFILISTRFYSVKETIRSRAISIPFRNTSLISLSEQATPAAAASIIDRIPAEHHDEIRWLLMSGEMPALLERVNVGAFLDDFFEALSLPAGLVNFEQKLTAWLLKGKLPDGYKGAESADKSSAIRDVQHLLGLAVYLYYHHVWPANWKQINRNSQTMQVVEDFRRDLQLKTGGVAPFALERFLSRFERSLIAESLTAK